MRTTHHRATLIERENESLSVPFSVQLLTRSWIRWGCVSDKIQGVAGRVRLLLWTEKPRISSGGTPAHGPSTLNLGGQQIASPRPWKMIRYFHSQLIRNPSRLNPLPATYGVKRRPPSYFHNPQANPPHREQGRMRLWTRSRRERRVATSQVKHLSRANAAPFESRMVRIWPRLRRCSCNPMICSFHDRQSIMSFPFRRKHLVGHASGG